MRCALFGHDFRQPRIDNCKIGRGVLPILALPVHLGVEIAVIENDCVGTSQAESD